MTTNNPDVTHFMYQLNLANLRAAVLSTLISADKNEDMHAPFEGVICKGEEVLSHSPIRFKDNEPEYEFQELDTVESDRLTFRLRSQKTDEVIEHSFDWKKAPVIAGQANKRAAGASAA